MWDLYADNLGMEIYESSLAVSLDVLLIVTNSQHNSLAFTSIEATGDVTEDPYVELLIF
jgi:hypothetical protein